MYIVLNTFLVRILYVRTYISFVTGLSYRKGVEFNADSILKLPVTQFNAALYVRATH